MELNHGGSVRNYYFLPKYELPQLSYLDPYRIPHNEGQSDGRTELLQNRDHYRSSYGSVEFVLLLAREAEVLSTC